MFRFGPSHMKTPLKIESDQCCQACFKIKRCHGTNLFVNHSSEIIMCFTEVCKAAVMSHALFFVTGRGGSMPVLLLVQWVQLIPQLCLTVLKDILGQTHAECSWLCCEGQKATHCLSEQELFIKEKAAIMLERCFVNCSFYRCRAEQRDRADKSLDTIHREIITNGSIDVKRKYLILYCT